MHNQQRPPRLVTFARLLVVVGAATTALGVIAGFGLLAADQDELALKLLSLAPVGMLVAFGGVVGALLGGPPRPQRGPEDD